MGYKNNAPTRHISLLPLAATLVAGLILLFALAPPARAVELGISDSDAATFTEPYWPGLGMNRARIVVPYDVATDDATPEAIRRREIFESYRANATAAGVNVLVAFGPSESIRAPDTGEPVAPSVEEFTDAFTRFRARYPDMVTIAPWNEPNNPDSTQYPLASDPALAAQYWLIAKSICQGCTVVAGSFAGIGGDDAYVDAYQAALGGARPEVWSFHAHGDINSFQASGPDSARVSRYFLSKLQGPWAGARIWIDEVGAFFRDPSGAIRGDAAQQTATQFLLGLASLDPRIDAIYYYNYSNQCANWFRCATQDRGLVSPSPFDGRPVDYDAFNRPRPAYNVIAQRGPVIVPAAPVPPVVAITQPAQSAALRNPAPTFTGVAATGGRAAGQVTLQIFPGAAATMSRTPTQTLTAPVAPVGGAWSATAARLRDGVYTAEASQAGNPSSSGVSQDVVFTIDTVAPTSTISAGPPRVTGARSATLTFAGSEPGTTFVCSVDRRTATPCTSPLRLTGLVLGTHSLGVRATDAAGNVQRTPTRYSWRVVSLATALAPRTGDLSSAFASGLPVAATCADSCRVEARVYAPAATASAAGLAGRKVSRRDPGRPRGKGYVTVATSAVVRRRAGSFALALRLRAAPGRSLRNTSSLGLRVGLALTPKGSKPTAVSAGVRLVRSGALRALAADGLPATLACSSACSGRAVLWVPSAIARRVRAPGRSVAGGGRTGLPRGGRYVALGSKPITRTKSGATHVVLPVPARVGKRVTRLPRAASVRVVGLASGPGTAASTLGWPLLLPR